MNKAIVWTFSSDNDQRKVSDRIGDLNNRIIKYDSDLSWNSIERSESTEAEFLREIEEIEATIANF
jgi:hypothetical protein